MIDRQFAKGFFIGVGCVAAWILLSAGVTWVWP